MINQSLLLDYFQSWITKVFIDLSQLKQSWYFPVDMKLVGSVGNIFFGYENSMVYGHFALLSFLLFIVSVYALTSGVRVSVIAFSLTFVPLVIVRYIIL